MQRLLAAGWLLRHDTVDKARYLTVKLPEQSVWDFVMTSCAEILRRLPIQRRLHSY